ncbi:MAG: carbohydrate-binding domain-containing protein, partial [Acutalibacteraceae bacterium]
GTITISGGTFNLTAGSDAIQAAQDVTITGGEFNIKTGSGYNDSSFDSDTMSCKGIKASCNADTTTTDSGTTDTTTDTSDATNTIEISGGTFTLNTADDAIHSDAYIVITGGTFDILTGDDGVHADTSLTLGTEGSTDNSLPDINVKSSYEGLEGGCVYIYSGRYKVAASDDGINAAGDSSTEDFNPGGGPGRPGQGGFGPGSSTGSGSSSGTTSDSEYNINIYGGYVYINVDGDGIDANSNITLTGGTIITWGQKAGGDNEPLDCDGTLTINGATVFASGSGQMVTTPSSSSQAYVQSRSTSISSGKIIDVIYNNSVVFNITAVKDINYTLYSSPDMTSSSGWSISNKSSSVSVPDDLFKAINGATADSSSMIFYGVAPGITSLDEYLEKSDSCSVEYSDSTLGTGTVICIYYNYEKVYEYTLLIFGDVNSDGWYDSQDAFIVNCIAQTLLTQSDVGAVKYLAADCNHDGTVDSFDAELLYSAGILLETIDQQSTSDEATAESVYTQYLALIDQNVSPTAASQAAETDSVETQPAEKS